MDDDIKKECLAEYKRLREALVPMTLTVVSKHTGIEYNVLFRFASGKDKTPKHIFIRKLQKFIDTLGE